jgi:two-component system osmolarity sensor histidine kinase EnvZ
MNWLPRSLFARHLWLIAGLLVLSQLISALAFREFVMRPRLRQSAEATARSLQAMGQALTLLPTAQRAEFARRFNERSGSGLDAAPVSDPRPSLQERAFLAELARQLQVLPAEIDWRREPSGLLAVRMGPREPGGEGYWLAIPSVLPGHQVLRSWLFASGAGALLALLGAGWIQRRLDRPLRVLMRAAEALGRGQRRVQIELDGPTEIATLAASFNQMSEALARDEEERLLMLAGLSHDLRTPLAKMRLVTELLRDGGQGEPELLDSLERSLHNLDGLLGQFLEYARAAHGGSSAEAEPPAPLELRELLGQAATLSPHRPAPALLAGETVRLRARPQALRRLVLNLIVNAQTHGGDPVELACGSGPEGAWLEVRDRGPGIPPERVEALKRPFERGDAARGGPSGSGLGLAIAERIARHEGARLALLPREGGGLVARLSFT